MRSGNRRSLKGKIVGVVGIAAMALWSHGAFADSAKCRALISQLLDEKEPTQGEAEDVVPNRGGATSSKPKKFIRIEDLFTFESVGNGLGFQPTKRIVAARPEEIAEIVKISKGDQNILKAIASELGFYFQHVPFATVSDALDLVVLRAQTGKNPDMVIESYDLVYQLLSNDSPHAVEFGKSSSVGLIPFHYIELTRMLLQNEKLSIEKMESLLDEVELKFPGHRASHQVMVLFGFLKMKEVKPRLSFTRFMETVDDVIANLSIKKPVMGFVRETEIRPNLQEGAAIVSVGFELNLNGEEILRVTQLIAQKTGAKSIAEITMQFYQMSLKEKSKKSKLE